MPFFRTRRGLDEDIVREISAYKSEPEWMTDFRVKAYRHFVERAMPTLGRRPRPDRLRQHLLLPKPVEEQASSWDDLPDGMRETWDKLGIPEAEKKYLAGVGAQYESEVVYHNLQKDLADQGVIFLDTDTGLREHEELFREYFGTIIPSNDNKFAALNSAVWSGGRSSTCRRACKVELPLQAYFRINAENMGQFERTLIIVDRDAYVHYVEGCTAPIYSTDSLHSAVVEIIVREGGRCRYTTIQNWSTNVYNLVTKRAVAEQNATMEWVDGNLGSQLTHEVPGGAPEGRGRARRGALDRLRRQGPAPGRGRQDHPHGAQHHVGDHLQVDLQGRRPGLVPRPAAGQRRRRRTRARRSCCDALILDEESRTDTYPYIDIKENAVEIGHEATVSKIGDEQLFYLMSRGLSEAEASAMMVSGFIEPITKELPLEYAVEMNRLIQLQMEGSVG